MNRTHLPFIVLLFCLVWEARAQIQPNGEPLPIVQSPGEYLMHPVWSPDGDFLAFTKENYQGIFIFQFGKPSIHTVTEEEGAGFGFSWAPDGSALLARPYEWRNKSKYHMVKVYELTGESKVLQAPTRALRSLPYWESGGTQVAVVMEEELHTFSTGKSSFKASKANGSVAGTRIYSSQNDHHHVADFNQFKGRILFNSAISPDGTMVAFQVGGLGLFVATTDGAELRQIGKGERPVWHPSGGYLVVTQMKDNGKAIIEGNLFAVDVSTGEYTSLTHHTDLVATQATLSPDGSQVVFDDARTGRLYLMDLQWK
jgi:Tol biopolymer transport system component